MSDTGVGFDSSRLDGPFRPFQRFHGTQEFQGTGLGLVTCQRIARRHGGDFRIASAPGQGTVATITLARAQCARAAAS